VVSTPGNSLEAINKSGNEEDIMELEEWEIIALRRVFRDGDLGDMVDLRDVSSPASNGGSSTTPSGIKRKARADLTYTEASNLPAVYRRAHNGNLGDDLGAELDAGGEDETGSLCGSGGNNEGPEGKSSNGCSQSQASRFHY
jgi:hypothetical protein